MQDDPHLVVADRGHAPRDELREVGRRRRARREPAPVGFGASTRSTRNVRQSPRSRSHATRYHRRPVWTSACGSIWRFERASSWARYPNRSRSWSRHAVAIVSNTSASTTGPVDRYGTVAAPIAWTRRRTRVGSSCSSFDSALIDVSSIPAMPSCTAVRRPTAIATASSSSSSSGGSCAPARSR